MLGKAVFDNLEVVSENSFGEVFTGEIGFCGLKERVMIWHNLSHVASSSCPEVYYLSVAFTLTETTGMVLCLIIC